MTTIPKNPLPVEQLSSTVPALRCHPRSLQAPSLYPVRLYQTRIATSYLPSCSSSFNDSSTIISPVPISEKLCSPAQV